MPKVTELCMQSSGLKPLGLTLDPPLLCRPSPPQGVRVQELQWHPQTHTHTPLSPGLAPSTTQSQRKTSLPLIHTGPHRGAVIRTWKTLHVREPKWNATILSVKQPPDFLKSMQQRREYKEAVQIILHLLLSVKTSTSEELWDFTVLYKIQELERKPFCFRATEDISFRGKETPDF